MTTSSGTPRSRHTATIRDRPANESYHARATALELDSLKNASSRRTDSR